VEVVDNFFKAFNEAPRTTEKFKNNLRNTP